MTPERWANVERLFHTALTRSEDEREAWLRQASAGDEVLRREVESLLAQASKADAFMDAPALVFTAREIAAAAPPPIAGRSFGPYAVLSLHGFGAMGEVYRANDTTLGREVALKVLPADFANDPDRLARFTREAQTLAALNHPNIAAIYGIEECDGVRALVMEFVDGEDLSAHIERGALPLAEALPIAQQIADALESAHEQGIIHRDLKPANIKIRSDGTVKVLDFGLAKGNEPKSTTPQTLTSFTAPSSSVRTLHGVILGTAAYMAPEQAKGKTVDKRADIWAFGVVLFEMLTGQRAFPGDDVNQTIALVLSEAPRFDALPSSTPSRLRRLLQRCIERDVRMRLRDIGEARVELARIVNDGGDEFAAPAPRRAATWWRPALGLFAAAACGAAIVGGAVGLSRRMAPERRPPPIHAFLDLPADHVLGEDDALVSLPTRTPMIFVPDGRSLVIQAARAGKPRLFLRSLDHPDAMPIAGTDDAHVPFVSPDGAWVGFWSADEIRKVPIGGGPAATICAMKGSLGPNGAAWGAGDVIVFGDEDSGRILRAPADGGVPVPVTPRPAIRRRHTTPFFLDSHRILFSDVSAIDAGDARLMVQSIDGGEPRLVLESASDGRVLPSGQLAFMRTGALMTVGFDPASAETRGRATVAIDAVMQSGLRQRLGAENTAAGMFAVSSLGTLIFVPGSLVGATGSTMIWVTPDGHTVSAEPSAGSPVGGRIFLRISPDGSRAIAQVPGSLRREMWLADWTRDAWTLCRECSGDSVGVWSPDGGSLLLGRSDALLAHTLDAATPDQVMIQEAGRRLVPAQWLTGGGILYESSPDSSHYEIKFKEPGSRSSGVLVPLGVGVAPALSPDGRLLAYTSVETGTREVVVQAFPGPGARVQISAGGGFNPAWSADGRTLYYYLRETEPPGSAIVAADIVTTPRLRAGRARELFRRGEPEVCVAARCYDIAPNGPRFLLREQSAVPRASVTRMHLVVNWAATVANTR